jgi:hypothetical protein
MSREHVEMITRMAAALRSARRVIADERLEQLSCFVVGDLASYKSVKEMYAAMIPPERAAIRRFDRALHKIDKALT